MKMSDRLYYYAIAVFILVLFLTMLGLYICKW